MCEVLPNPISPNISDEELLNLYVSSIRHIDNATSYKQINLWEKQSSKLRNLILEKMK